MIPYNKLNNDWLISFRTVLVPHQVTSRAMKTKKKKGEFRSLCKNRIAQQMATAKF